MPDDKRVSDREICFDILPTALNLHCESITVVTH